MTARLVLARLVVTALQSMGLCCCRRRRRHGRVKPLELSTTSRDHALQHVPPLSVCLAINTEQPAPLCFVSVLNSYRRSPTLWTEIHTRKADLHSLRHASNPHDLPWIPVRRHPDLIMLVTGPDPVGSPTVPLQCRDMGADPCIVPSERWIVVCCWSRYLPYTTMLDADRSIHHS